MSETDYADCWFCGRTLRARVDGTTFHHKGPQGQWLCPGVGKRPERDLMRALADSLEAAKRDRVSTSTGRASGSTRGGQA